MPLYLLIFFMGFLLPLFGQETLPTPQETPYDFNSDPILKEPDNFQGKFFNMLLVLGLLIGFMILASSMLKRLNQSRLQQVNQTSAIKIIETRALSPRSSLYLITFNNQEILIGESTQGIHTIASQSIPIKNDIA
jgi:flagellar protein FliO/FliZ